MSASKLKASELAACKTLESPDFCLKGISPLDFRLVVKEEPAASSTILTGVVPKEGGVQVPVTQPPCVLVQPDGGPGGSGEGWGTARRN